MAEMPRHIQITAHVDTGQIERTIAEAGRAYRQDRATRIGEAAGLLTALALFGLGITLVVWAIAWAIAFLWLHMPW